MSAHGRRIDDLELDGLLRALLADDADAAPNRIAAGALEEVARTPQARGPLLRPRWTMRSWPERRVTPAWTSAAAVLVATSLLVGAVLAVIGPFSPTPSPTPSSPAASDLIQFTSPEAGYELLVPATWLQVGSGFPDALRWEGPDGALMISYGDSVLDGGEISVCGPYTPEFGDCETLTFRYSIPYDPERDGIGAIAFDWYASNRCEGGCEVVRADTTLDGEPAEMNRIHTQDPRIAQPVQATYITLFHDRRPVILYWVAPLGQEDTVRIQAMRASFRFLDPAPEPSPTVFIDPTELVPFIDTEAGFEMLVPRFWGEGVARGPGVREFGEGAGFGTHADPALTISIGATDGTVTICQDNNHVCRDVVVTSMDELDAALRINDVEVDAGVPPERTGELVLAGEPGRWKRPAYPPAGSGPLGLGETNGGNCLGCPSVVYHAYAIVDGRPVVLTFDFWTIAFGDYDAEYLAQIIESLRVL